MNKITLCAVLMLSCEVFAQTTDPEQTFLQGVNKSTSVNELMQKAKDTGDKGLYARQEVVLKRLIQLRPFRPDLRVALVKAYAQQDKKSEAYNGLIELQKAGLSYPVGDNEAFDKIKDTGAFTYIEEGMVNNAVAFGEGKKEFEVSSDYSGMLFENLVFDQTQNRFLLGSVRAGAVYQYTEKEGFKEFVNPSNPTTGPWGIIDLAIDEKADLLWLASATMPHYSGTTQNNFGRAMISKLKLSTGELLNSFAMAQANEPMLFNNLHVTEGQNLYFTNAFSGDLFKISNGGQQVEPQMKLAGLGSIKAITSNTKETILYVSDYDQGLFVVNLETKQLAMLFSPESGFFSGINDLFYDNGDLVAIQSGVSPARLMRYVLKDDLFLQNNFPIEASNPNFNGLGNGTLVGDKVYYAANSQWTKINGMGQLLPETTWEPLVIMQSPTRYKMKEHLERMRQIEEIKKRRGVN